MYSEIGCWIELMYVSVVYYIIIVKSKQNEYTAFR